MATSLGDRMLELFVESIAVAFWNEVRKEWAKHPLVHCPDWGELLEESRAHFRNLARQAVSEALKLYRHEATNVERTPK